MFEILEVQRSIATMAGDLLLLLEFILIGTTALYGGLERVFQAVDYALRGQETESLMIQGISFKRRSPGFDSILRSTGSKARANGGLGRDQM